MTTLLPNASSAIPSLPDGPSEPQWWQTLQGIFRPFYYSETARDRYGDIFTFRFLNSVYVVVSNPEGIQTIFTANPELFDSGTANATFFTGSLWVG